MTKAVEVDAAQYANLVWQQFMFELRLALRPWTPGQILFHYVDELNLGRFFIVEIPKWDLKMRYMVSWLSMQNYMGSDEMARELAKHFTKQFTTYRPVEPEKNIILGDN